ncbi:MIM2 (YLR099W-A) [Zygosaccharomyces parabailii]|uniref:ZYBA0S07-03070g1_1 n=1 Tax=Zygosaccharomyces bailii (strain CLIB 213 / ATCC 58445 / CBS 680 / BCRC 21525 / NBRC 1098 / NCYC 1416 / NRRL Y-2227) TaxID=1333698 RepID=A0A8J2T7Y5_ZYGB2|nr:MIM2 (YLR099W-A) [Zygosaccharomyces parabailii]CDF90527.1 ZYBA0S07-03070g1_1 [Zygosaccharomyces bailii CLIB 213]CDH15107.1 uncharacterized protein ZBAI_06894 [Zygosaccharomyces bailii ISA1307]SJM84104.1 uncharacterized protein ZBIST_1461 [Zygosaccharomyces bailii]
MNSGDESRLGTSVDDRLQDSLRQEIGEAVHELEIEDELLDAYDYEDTEEEGVESGEEDEAGYSDHGTDPLDDYFDAQLLDAQRQWEESLEQLNKVLNWILLPLVGKFLGRRVAKTIWKQAMEYFWR